MNTKAPIPAISIKQPWAELILQSKKTIEIRPWDNPYRGDLYLHTGKMADGYKIFTLNMPDVFRGGYVGVMELTTIVPFTPERWEKWRKQHLSEKPFRPGLYAFIIRNARRFIQPIPGPGELKLFWPKPEIVEKLNRSQFV